MGKTILLISGNTETIPVPVYPLALPKLAAVAALAGHTAVQFDLLYDGKEKLSRALDDIRPDIIGVSIRNIDNTNVEDPCAYIEQYRSLIEQIRLTTPQTPIVLGGSGYSLFPKPLLQVLGADLGVVGEGDNVLVGILDSLPETARAAGSQRIIYGNGICKNNVWHHQALHDSHLVEYYWSQGGMIGIQTKRGCPKRCSYCTYPLIEGNEIRWREPEDVVDEIEGLLTGYGITYFYFTDSVFNLSIEREVELAEELCRRALPVSWGAFFSPCRLEREYLAILKRSGLKHVEMGTDSLCDEMLHVYRKDFDATEALRSSSLCLDMGLYCAHYFLFGGPGETAETVRETMDKARLLPKSVFFPFTGIRVYPGADICMTAREEGLFETDEFCLDPVFYVSPAIKGMQLEKLLEPKDCETGNWVFSSTYRKFAPLMCRLRQKGARGPLWERLIR